ncbi:MAG: YcxB family protein [Erysipelotrichaceae bacterium]|nr:YcxB family protein [Erysipelotrichaceae bacterium]
MNEYVNTFRYTRKIAREELTFKYHYDFRYLYIVLGMGTLMVFMQFLIEKNFVFVLILLGFALVFLFTQRYNKVRIIRDLKKIRKQYPEQSPVVRVEINEAIRVSVDGNETMFSWDTYQGFWDTEHLIILLFQKGNRLVLHKKGFQQGNAESCMEFLKTKKPAEPFSRLF